MKANKVNFQLKLVCVQNRTTAGEIMNVQKTDVKVLLFLKLK